MLAKLLLIAMTISANDNPADNAPVKMPFRNLAEMHANAALAKGPDGENAIEVTGLKERTVAELIVTDSPKITSHQYVVRGKVKYEDVIGEAYLELWNDFGEQGQYFSRSLGDWGGMRKIAGTSDWRTFELPFTAKPGMIPQKLFVNVVMPGTGKIVVTEPVAVSLGSATSMWWTDQQGGLVGGIAGSLLGLLGAVIGVVAGSPKFRFLSVPLHVLGIAVGVCSLITGIVAVSTGQPYHVFYPLLLIGTLAVVIFPVTLITTSRVRREVEVRQMEAIDALGH